jgi:SAM-dependent methyltransferase
MRSAASKSPSPRRLCHAAPLGSGSAPAPAPDSDPDLWLLDRVPLRAWDRILILEGGDGRLAEEARRRIARGYVCGLDLSGQVAEKATQLRGVPGQLEFDVWDGTSLPFDDGAFDRIIAKTVTDGMSKPLALLCELCRVLRPGGEIFVFEENGDGPGRLHALKRVLSSSV